MHSSIDRIPWNQACVAFVLEKIIVLTKAVLWGLSHHRNMTASDNLMRWKPIMSYWACPLVCEASMEMMAH